ncbi:hypothetical protein SeLEV6574_g03983 [Synchytrium endobioticum]|uniref:Uncharacterized protein n=1 Tax=Synchytrium endobioticum TaxID=286115 RepID=A0A507D1W6_9FUNG|nr:hypothetical protein SeLEV6574_g03983 [Synchytrium endobioticum]
MFSGYRGGRTTIIIGRDYGWHQNNPPEASEESGDDIDIDDKQARELSVFRKNYQGKPQLSTKILAPRNTLDTPNANITGSTNDMHYTYSSHSSSSCSSISTSASLDFETVQSRPESKQEIHVTPRVSQIEAYTIADQSRPFEGFIPNMTPTFSGICDVSNDQLDRLLAYVQSSSGNEAYTASPHRNNVFNTPALISSTKSPLSLAAIAIQPSTPSPSPTLTSPIKDPPSFAQQLNPGPRPKPAFQFTTIDAVPEVDTDGCDEAKRYDSAINLYSSTSFSNLRDKQVMNDDAKGDSVMHQNKPSLADFERGGSPHKALTDTRSASKSASPQREALSDQFDHGAAADNVTLTGSGSKQRSKKSQKKKKKKFKTKKSKSRTVKVESADDDSEEAVEAVKSDDKGLFIVHAIGIEKDGRPPVARQAAESLHIHRKSTPLVTKSPILSPTANSSPVKSKVIPQSTPAASRPQLSVKVLSPHIDLPPLSAPLAPTDRKIHFTHNVALSANDAETCETIMLTTSEMLPAAMYGLVLDTLINKLGYEIESLTRRSWSPQPRNRRDFDTRSILSVLVSHRSDTVSIPLTTDAGLAELHLRCISVLKEPGWSFGGNVTSQLLSSTPSNLFSTTRPPHHVVKRDKSKSDIDALSQLLPAQSNINNKLAGQTFFNACTELPQIVFIAARMHVGIQLLRKLTEPRRASSRPITNIISTSGLDYELAAGNRFELLGCKVIPHMTLQHARLLTPYEVHERQYSSSLDVLTSAGTAVGGEQRWLLLVCRRMQAYEHLEQAINTLMESYTSPVNNKICKALLPGIDEKDIARLSVIAVPSPEYTFHAIASFFHDTELLSGDSSEWEDKGCLPPEYYSPPFVLQNMIQAPQLLCTTVVMSKRMFPLLGKVLARIQREGFVLTGLKMQRLSTNMARKFVSFADEEGRFTPSQRDEFVRRLCEGPIMCGLIARENGVRRWLDVLDDIYLKSGGKPVRQGDALPDPMQFGLYGSPSLRAAIGQRQVLFAENPPIEARIHVSYSRYMRKVVPCAPTDLPPPSRKCYALNNRGQKASSSGEAQLCCVLLLNLASTYEQTLSQWAQICLAILGNASSTSPDATASSCGNGQQQRGRSSRRDSSDRAREGISSTCTTGSDDATGGVVKDDDVFRLVGCRLICVREAVAEKVAGWSALSNSNWGAVGDGIPIEMTLRSGPTLVLAIEKERGFAPALLRSKLDRLDRSLRRCMIASQSHEEAKAVLPQFFGDLHGSSYRIRQDD